MAGKKSESTALPRSGDAKKSNLDPGPSTKGTMAERDARQHSAETGSPKPVNRPSTGASKVSDSKSGRSGTSRSGGTPSQRATNRGGKKTRVQVTLEEAQVETLDNLRRQSSRHDYLQQIVGRHLEEANPNASFQEDDDLPGNEREVNAPNFRV